MKDKTVSASVTFNIPANPAITTAGGALTAGQVGAAYTATVAVSGGISPYTWTITAGNLPTGLTVASSSGIISGTPTAAGSYTFTLKVTDSGTPTALAASAQFSIDIAAAPAIVFTTTSLANGTIGTAYSAAIAATGGAGALTDKVTTGSLPAGLSLSSAGAITGTPTAGGTSNFKVTASDAYGDSAVGSFSITIGFPQLTITTTTLPTGYVGSAYPATTMAASGGSNSGYSWTWAGMAGGMTPVGLSLSKSGVITGTPTEDGIYHAVFTVTDSAQNTASATLTLTVNAAVSVTRMGLPIGYVGSAYSAATLAATGGAGAPYTWTWVAATGSSPPPGLGLSSAGVISGTPSAAATYSVTVTAKDAAGNTGSNTLTILVDAGVTVATTPAPPSGYPQSAYPAFTFSASGGAGAPYTWSWAAAGGSATPPGLSLDPATGLLSGTPSAGGTYNVVVTATDSAKNTGQATFSIVIEASLAITTASPLPGGTPNVAYSQTLTATGGSGSYTWSTTGTNTLSTVGLSFAGGVVSGTPSATGTATFTAVVTDTQSHSTQASFNVTVSNALTITTTTLAPVDAGSAYSQTLAAAGGTGTGYTWTATSSNLSAFGLSLSTAGVVSGTPTPQGTASFTANVKDSGGNTATQALTITIDNALSQDATNLPLTATIGVSFSGSIAGAGGSGSYCWTVTGASDGLSAPAPNAPCGYVAPSLPISGTPTAAGNVPLTVKLIDTTTGDSLSLGYTIAVSNPQPLTLPTSNPSTLGSATVNTAYTGSITATGGVAPFTWKINGVAVSGSLALTDSLSATNNGATLNVAGTPTATGTVTLQSVTVTDSEAAPVTAGPVTYTIAVSQTSNITGAFNLINTFNCGDTGPGVPPITVTLRNNSGVVTTTTTGSDGGYTFTNVANGTYTIVPSITGADSVFVPAVYSGVVINNNSLEEDFTVQLGYNVSGNLSYSGSKTGQTYIVLQPTNCNGVDGVPGTSISAATLAGGGQFALRGVPPGQYQITAWMDTLGQGQPNTSDPAGTGANVVNVTSAKVTGVTDTLVDPTLNAPSVSPTLKDIAPTDQGVVITFGGGSVSNSQGVEMFTSYTIQWSATATSFTGGGSATFQAIGRTANIWILNNAIHGITGSFTNGTPYYFRVRGINPAGNGPWAYWAGPKNDCAASTCATSVTVGAAGASSGWNLITGSVALSPTVNVNPGAVLYTGFYDQNSNTAYATAIANPSSSNSYAVYVPSGSNYIHFGILDQNDDGLIDAGDVNNVNSAVQPTLLTITGPMSNQTLNLAGFPSGLTVTTTYYGSSDQNGNPGPPTTSYSLGLTVREGDRLPVDVALISGPNVINPIDLSSYCGGCGSLQYGYFPYLGGAVPQVGDMYTFEVLYADDLNSPGDDSANVNAVLGNAQMASGLTPNSGTSGASTLPAFTWAYPANASSYTFSFQLTDQYGNTIWQIPGPNANSGSFTSTQIPMPAGFVYGTDPTDPTNTPALGALASGTQYNWQVITIDSNGNQAVIESTFTTE